MLEEEHRHTLKHAVITFIAALLGGFLAFPEVLSRFPCGFEPFKVARRAVLCFNCLAR